MEERPFQGRVRWHKECGLLAPVVVFPRNYRKLIHLGLKPTFDNLDAALKRRSSTLLRPLVHSSAVWPPQVLLATDH